MTKKELFLALTAVVLGGLYLCEKSIRENLEIENKHLNENVHDLNYRLDQERNERFYEREKI